MHMARAISFLSNSATQHSTATHCSIYFLASCHQKKRPSDLESSARTIETIRDLSDYLSRKSTYQTFNSLCYCPLTLTIVSDLKINSKLTHGMHTKKLRQIRKKKHMEG